VEARESCTTFNNLIFQIYIDDFVKLLSFLNSTSKFMC